MVQSSREEPRSTVLSSGLTLSVRDGIFLKGRGDGKMGGGDVLGHDKFTAQHWGTERHLSSFFLSLPTGFRDPLEPDVLDSGVTAPVCVSTALSPFFPFFLFGFCEPPSPAIPL